MVMAKTDATAGIGSDVARIDGRLKVTGEARYGSDFAVPNPAYAVFKTSAIARGRIAAIDDGAARSVPGVLDILTYRDVGDEVGEAGFFASGGYAGTTIRPLASDRIWHDGQIVAVVLADSFEAAREAAHRLVVDYAAEPPAAGFDGPGVEEEDAKKDDPAKGDAERALREAAVMVEADYATPTQHHNPIELFTTTCAWTGDRLTIWEPSQNVYGIRNGVAKQLSLDPEQVRVVSPYVGGAFGSRGSLTQRTALIALAAKRLNRPVKLMATRDQGYTIATYRAETRHRVRLGADAQGRLQALSHEGWEVTSRPDSYKVAGTSATTRVYACSNIASEVTILHADRNTPGFMRSPPEVPYVFALESAMDELAVKLGMDPIELRRINDTDVEPVGGKPFTTRSLMKCFDAGAKAFGWSERDPTPGSMRDGDWLVGWGCATTLYPTHIAPATARVTLTPAGKAIVRTAAHDIGTGAYTAIALTAADRLGLPLDRIAVEIGDTNFPPAPVAGGSNTTASVCNVVAKACEQVRGQLASAVTAAGDGPFAGSDPNALILAEGELRGPGNASEAIGDAMARASSGAIEAYAENVPDGLQQKALGQLYQGLPALTGGAQMEDRAQFAFGAEFIEVRVNARTREIRCPRALGVFAAGQIVSRRTAESQLIGGLIWGMSSALHEVTEIDRGAARYYNDDLAEYLIPVNADIGKVEVMILPEDDEQVNALGIKGLGELGNVGTNAAIANAVYHATGVRIRSLPIRIEKLLGDRSA
ncbi:MAG: xanthine dehydrogenase [Rhodospirillaceae bacterium]|nr:xanthine dehydrogenase [Rhodospirillaceae bacterium]